MAPDTHPASTTDAHDGHPVAEAAEAVHGHEVAAGATEVAAHGGEGGGLPQFEFEYWGGQIVWLLLLFAILYFLFSRVFVPRFRKIADTRAETIAMSLEDARKVQAEADARAAAVKEQIDRARAESRRLVADAQAAAQADMARTQAAQEAELSAKMGEAETRIRGMRDQAMSNVTVIAADVANTMVEKVTGKPVSPDEARLAGGVA
jgi:F-type H+-transporting ATPase subunit b